MPDSKQPATGPAGLTAQDWNSVGIPVAGPAEPQWNVDLFAPTTQDLAEGHPLAGRSPWPTD